MQLQIFGSVRLSNSKTQSSRSDQHDKKEHNMNIQITVTEAWTIVMELRERVRVEKSRHPNRVLILQTLVDKIQFEIESNDFGRIVPIPSTFSPVEVA